MTYPWRWINIDRSEAKSIVKDRKLAQSSKPDGKTYWYARTRHESTALIRLDPNNGRYQMRVNHKNQLFHWI